MKARARAAIDLALLLILIGFCFWLLAELANPQTAKQLRVTSFVHAIVHNVETLNPQRALFPTEGEFSPVYAHGIHTVEGA